MDERFENILRKTGEMFLKFGIRSVSMDDICREMGISKKTLYQYVKNKKDLIYNTLEFSLNTKFVELMKDNDEKMNAIDKLLNSSKMVNKVFKEYNTSAVFDLEKYYPELYKDFLEKRRKIIFERIKNNIREGKSEGLYREDLKDDLVALLYMQKLEDITSSDAFKMKKASFTKIFEVMFENHIRGISNKSGIKYFEDKKEALDFKL